jgi:epoxyqueuosine reductase
VGAGSKDADRREKLTMLVKRLAAEAGFDLCRITAPDLGSLPRLNLNAYVKAGYHGTMTWMEETAERRSSPLALWPDVRSVIMLGLNYAPDVDPRAALMNKSRGNISVYARNRDYHDIIKGRLKDIGSRFVALSGAEIKVFVDTAPVMEKPLAASAGLGWQGKHTNLVSREFGSWLFLGSIFTTADLIPDMAETDHCGSCRACIDACPSNAFPAPYRIDARRCISYLTIEHKGPIPLELRPLIGNRIYGCDDCLSACPWNKFATAGHELKLAARADLKEPPLGELLALDDRAFREKFSGSPVKRIGRNRFIRNCLIAAGNSLDESLVPIIEPLLADASADVRSMAIWALDRLGGLADTDRSRQLRENETDMDVIAEWRGVGALM